jgi:hypothetical protein
MRIARWRHLALPLLFVCAFPGRAHGSGSNPATGTAAQAQPAASVASAVPAAPTALLTVPLSYPAIYPQVVRLSLVQGDVRVFRGDGRGDGHGKDADWEKATADLPLQTGFNLVTGAGRAEIEFEDASTAYLGENSVLSFEELSTLGTAPRTELMLLSGTLTVNLRLTMPGESFLVQAPTDHFSLSYPERIFVRVGSYVDAMTLTAQRDSLYRFSEALAVKKGQTVTLHDGHLEALPAASAANSFADWDTWVEQRVAARDAATAAVMQEAHLNAPVPGLADMQGRGDFFACAPYGTCWEPTGGWQKSTPNGPASSSAALAGVRNNGQPRVQPVAFQVVPSNPVPGLAGIDDDDFPCLPLPLRRLITRDPTTGQLRSVGMGVLPPGGLPYLWAICHTGTWIHHQHRYVWVAGTKRHHRSPVRWVKYGRSSGFVPLHPYDLAGKLPLNLRHGVFLTSGKNNESVERVSFSSTTQVTLLGAPPKSFERPYLPPLQRAEAPHLEAHLIKDGLLAKPGATERPAGLPLTFDHKSQSFLLAHQVTQGGKTITSVQHFGGFAGSGHSGGGGGFGRSGGGSGGGGSSHFSGSSGSSGSSSGGSHSSSGGTSSSSGGGGGGAHK